MKKVKIVLLLLLALVSQPNVFSQNLVNNPSFETAAWLNGNNGSVDWLTGPTNVFGAENARTGTRYMGESMGRSPLAGSDFREYITNTLSSALVVGNTYECSIWVSLSENYGDYACNKIGFAMTTSQPSYAFNNSPIPLSPVYTCPNVITNKVGWTQVSGSFVASNAATWVTVGNFDTQTNATWTYVGPGATFYYGYYFMDDVCIGPPGACGVVLPIELLSFSAKQNSDRIDLDWITSSELDCKFFVAEKSSDGLQFSEIGRIDGHGTTHQAHQYHFSDTRTEEPIVYYRIKQFDINEKVHFSDIVSVKLKSNGIQDLKVFPVPSSGDVNIQFDTDLQLSQLTILNPTGNIVYSDEIQGSNRIVIKELPAGTYLARMLTYDGSIRQKKFVIIGK